MGSTGTDLRNIRTHLRVIVKRNLCMHGRPPDRKRAATKIVIEQADVLFEEWVA